MPRFAVVDRLALFSIGFYQRHLSPRKGFSCAYRCHTGCRSCSHLGFRAIRRYGLFSGLPILRQRLQRCSVAHRRLSHMHARRNQQAGFCDASCDIPCDGIDLDCAGPACDVFSGCDGPADCGNWGGSKKSSEEEKYVYIPPDTRKYRR